jgi:Flp pilus assembly protein TadD
MDIDEAIQLAIKHKQEGNFQQAEMILKQILKIQPTNANIYFQLGSIYKSKGQVDKAIISYQIAIQINPCHGDAYNDLGNSYQIKGQVDNAITCYQKAIQIDPNHALAYYNLGNIYLDKGQFDEAIVCYQQTLQLKPNIALAYNNQGIALQWKGQLNEAITFYKNAIDIDPTFAPAHLNLSLALLLSGDFKEGWKEREWRWKIDDITSPLHKLPLPLWDGSNLRGKTIFIYGEQGIGDEIMFASCLSELIAQADLCVVECDKRLIPLFSRSFPKALMVERFKENRHYPTEALSSDMKIAFGSILKFLRPNLTRFPQQEAYLIADVEKVNMWQKRFKALGKGLKIGISWRGGSKPNIIRTRSIVLEKWAELFSIPKIHFINLQYGDCNNELAEAKEKLGVIIHDWEDADSLKDLDNFAAQIAALDLVISVDNSTVHMAGALGVPTWVLLPFVPDWRWMLNREDSPWYLTIKLFRQPSIGDWESVIAYVKDELLKLLSNK